MPSVLPALALLTTSDEAPHGVRQVLADQAARAAEGQALEAGEALAQLEADQRRGPRAQAARGESWKQRMVEGLCQLQQLSADACAR